MLTARSRAGSLLSSGENTTVFSRLSGSLHASQASLTPFQAQIDGLVSHFVQEAANPTTLAAIMAGGMAYRFGRVGVMSVGAFSEAPLLARPLSVAAGLGAEVTAFEFTGRALASDRNPNRWKWSGQGGWAQGLSTSAITFGMLKGAGFLAREQNIVLQHAFQSTAMVAGHNSAGLLGIAPRQEGSLAEQLLHAEATNLQLGAGMGLLHAMAPGIHAFERGMDLSLRARDSRVQQSAPLPELAMAGATTGSPSPRPSPSRGEGGQRRNPNGLMMSSTQGGDGNGNGNGGGEKPLGGVIRGEFYAPKESATGETPRKSSTEIIRHSVEMTWGELMRISPFGMGIFRFGGGNTGKIVMGNRRLERMFGYTLEEAMELSILDFFHPEEISRISEHLQNYTEPVHLEDVRINKKNGEFIWCDVGMGVVELNNHRLMFTTIDDVSKRRQTHEALKASEAQKRALINAIPDAIYRVSREGIFLDVHAGREAVLVLPRETLLSTRLGELNLPPELVQLGLQTVEKALQTQITQKVEFQLPTPGGIRHQEARVVDSGPDEVVGIVRDITDRKLAEAERLRLTQIIEASTDYISMATPDGHIFYNNPAGRRMMGFASGEEFTRRSVADNHPPWVLDLFSREAAPALMKNGVWVGESALLHRDGREIPISQMIIAHREPGGALKHFSTIIRDISEMKRAERDRIAAERLDALRRVANLLAHDINQALTGITAPLTGIEHAIARLKSSRGGSSETPILDYMSRSLKIALEQADRVRDMNVGFRELNTQYKPGPPITLERLLDPQRLQGILTDPAIRLEVIRQEGDATVPGPEELIDRVITNIISNAKDAMEGLEVKNLRIETSVVPFNPNDHTRTHSPSLIGKAHPEKFVKIIIEDSGTGMDEETLIRIFEPDFSGKTKSHAGHGGFGLTSVLRVVQDLGGSIQVRSQIGQGSIFEILLPEGRQIPFLDRETEESRPKRISSPLPPSETPIETHLLEEEPLMVVVADQNNNIVYANGEARRTLGKDPVGNRIEDYFSARSPSSGPIRLTTPGGKEILLEDRQHPFISGLTVYYFIDVTGREQLQDEIVRLRTNAGAGFLARGVLHDARSALTAGALVLPRLEEIINSGFQSSSPRRPGPSTGMDLSDPKTLFSILRSSLEDAYRILGTGKNILRGGTADLSLHDILLDILQQNLPLRVESHIQLKTELSPNLGVFGNRQGLSEALRNILENACHAMPEGGLITVRASTLGREAVIEISDTGQGIASENLNRIFDDHFTTKGEKGSGLGLAMVKKIIEEGHHGRIEVESELGRGTTFRIHLPLLNSEIPTP